VLVDSRLSPQPIDLKFVEWLGDHNVPFVIVFTKIDKLAQRDWQKNVEEFKKVLKESWDELPYIIVSSSVKKLGKDEILGSIQKAMGNVG